MEEGIEENNDRITDFAVSVAKEKIGRFRECREIGDGNLNYIYRVNGDKGSVVVKLAPPYIRCLGSGYPFTEGRILYEIEAIRSFGSWESEITPKIYGVDESLFAVAMEDLSSYEVLRGEFFCGRIHDFIYSDLGRRIGRIAFETSIFSDEKKNKEGAALFKNVEMRNLTSEYVFTIPFYTDVQDNSPLTPSDRDIFRNNEVLLLEIGILKKRFNTACETLQHGDLHTGSLMTNGASYKLIDFEFAFYGPVGFDAGTFIANLIFAWIGSAEDKSKEVLMKAVADFAVGVVGAYEERLLQKVSESFLEAGVVKREKELLLNDICGYAAVELLRRVLGVAKVADITGIRDSATRKRCEMQAMETARELLLGRGEIREVDSFLQLLNASL